ncbi:MAG: rhomboid family intramembrane serine protease [Ktedonobacterales bacterium]
MEQVTDVQSLIEHGDALLKEIRVNEAAAEYARAAQADPTAVGAHMGLAEANLALGQYGITTMACQRVMQLAPESADAALAQAILFLLERRYDAALTSLDRVVELDPPRAYAHAMRGYCLRQQRQTYDASLAESKAARLSGTHELTKLFPQVTPAAAPVPFPAPGAAYGAPVVAPAPYGAPTPVRTASAQPRPWSERPSVERRAVQARFMTRNVPVLTFALIIINTLIYAACVVLSGGDLMNTSGHSNIIYDLGVQLGWKYIVQDPTQLYRIFTAMFLHESIIHIGLNMLSLYFVGVITEQVFGKWRFLTIYLVSGIVGGLAQAYLVPGGAALGASGAIFGIFGAFGAFIILNRRGLGAAANGIIAQWFFWLAINLVFSFNAPNIGLYDHLGGLAAGLILAILLSTPRRR